MCQSVKYLLVFCLRANFDNMLKQNKICRLFHVYWHTFGVNLKLKNNWTSEGFGKNSICFKMDCHLFKNLLLRTSVHHRSVVELQPTERESFLTPAAWWNCCPVGNSLRRCFMATNPCLRQLAAVFVSTNEFLLLVQQRTSEFTF